MAKFINCVASNNGGAGFCTNNPYTEFINCQATNNKGGGFIDNSGKLLIKNYLVQFKNLNEEIEKSITLSKLKKDDLKREVRSIIHELKSSSPSKSIVSKALERVKDITKEHAGEYVGRTIFEFASRSPEILAQLFS